MKHTTINVDGYELKYLLYLDNSDPYKSNHWLFHIHTKENTPGLDLADQFKDLCYEMPKSLNWFHQGGCKPRRGERSEWHMFEFWSNDEAAILEAAMQVANDLGLELQFGPMERVDLDFIFS